MFIEVSDDMNIQLLCKLRKITKIHTNDMNLLLVDKTFLSCLLESNGKKMFKICCFFFILFHFAYTVGKDVTAFKINKIKGGLENNWNLLNKF